VSGNTNPQVRELMQGAVDTHVHSAPDLVPRKLDDYDVARQARERGMAAVVLKNHFLSTALRAPLIEQQVPGIRLIGSVVLNGPMGGMNPWAVEAAGRGGAKVVWMPTFQAENQVAYQSRPGAAQHRAGLEVKGRQPGVPVFDQEGNLSADTIAVLEIIRDRGMVLATGHLSPTEVDKLTAQTEAMGLKKVISTHPDMLAINIPPELQRRLSERGVFFERTFNITTAPGTHMNLAALAGRIREVGYESTIMATDFGQLDNASPAEGLEAYIEGLLDNGFSAAEVRRMSSENARGLLEV
jgi:Family of unknown function (DUF6282)